MVGCDLLTNYIRVLLLIGQDPDTRVRDIVAATNLTERAVQRIVWQLEADDYLSHMRIGRRNSYTINREKRIEELGLSIGELLDLVARKRSAPTRETVPVRPAPGWKPPKAQR